MCGDGKTEREVGEVWACPHSLGSTHFNQSTTRDRMLILGDHNEQLS